MQFLNPKTDFAFKKIFGSPQSKPILTSFLEALLYGEQQVIVDLDILDPYQAPKLTGWKDTYLDIKAKLADGTVVIIEMQVLNVESFEKRILYNAAKAYSLQLVKGQKYHLLYPVIALTITDFEMFPEGTKIISRYALREQDSQVAYCPGEFELVFVELPKFKKSLADLETLTEKWLFFLKYARTLTDVPPSLGEVDAIDQAFAVANQSNFSPEELEDHEKREIFIWDQRNAMIKAEKTGLKRGLAEGLKQGIEQGLQQGIEQGREQGLQEGKYQTALAIARQLLNVLDAQTISQKTGLAIAEIEQLKASHLN
ncbi:MAG: Rpn family recombination-promoting nuclease/putative transposase [Cyanobacteria bacterium P01_G01_bin.54]